MSASNYIQIKRVEEEYIVSERDYESDDLIEEIGTSSNAEGALVMAEHFIRDNEVEYGVRYEII